MTQNDKKRNPFSDLTPGRTKMISWFRQPLHRKKKKPVSFGEEKLICEMTEVKNENMIHDAVMIQFIFARRFTTALSKGHRNEELEPFTIEESINKMQYLLKNIFFANIF